jgi:transposase
MRISIVCVSARFVSFQGVAMSFTTQSKALGPTSSHVPMHQSTPHLKPMTSYLDETLWRQLAAVLEPSLDERTSPGRPPADVRRTLNGILHILRTGMPWSHLPADLGLGSGMNCLRYLRAWQRDGKWSRVESILRSGLIEPDRFDWRRVDDRRTKRRKRSGVAPPVISTSTKHKRLRN